MRSIFFISLMNGAAWGGSEELWHTAALYASKKGWPIGCAVYYWPQKEYKIQELSQAGCKVYWLPNKGREKKNFIQKLQYKITKSGLKKYLRSLPVNEYDMVVINQGGFEISTSALKNFYTRLGKYALLFHNYGEEDFFKVEKAKALQNWLKAAAVNLFAAKRIQEVLEEKLQLIIPNADVLINPISFGKPAEITEYPAVQIKQYLFIMLAALDVKRKAQDNLIKCFSSLKWKERNWVLFLYGEGEDKDLLQTLIKSNNLSHKIFLKGHTKNVKAALKEAHLVLQITHKDAMPISVVEGMAISRPIVVSNIGDMPKWVEQNVNGWISKNATPEEIDQTLETAWENRAQWAEMGKASFQIFKEKYPDSPEEYFLQQLSIT